MFQVLVSAGRNVKLQVQLLTYRLPRMMQKNVIQMIYKRVLMKNKFVKIILFTLPFEPLSVGVSSAAENAFGSLPLLIISLSQLLFMQLKL